MTGRQKEAADRYRQANREERHEMILFSQCDDGRTLGLLRGYMATDFETLARIRSRKASTRSAKIKRKADFYFALARMAERAERLPNYLTINTGPVSIVT